MMGLEVSESVSNKFRNMSIVCALFVVIIHCRPRFEQGCISWYVKELLENGVCEIAVPFFFLASGFFIAQRIEDGRYGVEIGKRVRTLLLPYIFWLLLFILFQMCIVRHFTMPSLTQLGLDPFHCPALSPLWYVRALFCFSLLSPALIWLLKKSPLMTLMVFGCLYGVVCPYAPMPRWSLFKNIMRIGPVPVLGLFYFSLGMAIRLGLVKFVWKRTLTVLCFAMGVALVIGRAVLTDFGYGLAGVYCGFMSIPLLIIGFWELIPERLWPKVLIASAFPIYLTHKFFYPFVAHWCDKTSLFGYFSLFVCVFALSLVATVTLRRLSPKFVAVVFGGR